MAVFGRRGWRLSLVAAAAGLFPALAGAQKSPEETVQSFKLAPGLEATAWAGEPEMVNPTNIDIDEKGRIWVLEAANYRGSHLRPEGDRILILEDTHHTGKCDSVKVFAQSPKLFAPLGICKLGNKLFVAQSPNVWVYTIDDSGDHPVGEPQLLFTGFGGENHDHGVHAGVFGPDGRYYFNCGNEGSHSGVIKHGDGKPIVDILGSEIGHGAKMWRGKEKPRGVIGYQEGMAFACGLDGSDFEVIGYNFRNNYELCVDSFGTVWQSDNDDDGNQGVRINYVMEGGNFGYHGPKGTDWGRDMRVFPGQTRQEAHWHQRWPGIVPNLLHTGGGSPTGIVIYEGDLLPEQYRGALLHCDAGPNVVRAYRVTPSEHIAKGIMNNDGDESALDKPGAGYKAEPIEMIKAGDSWFRPSDLCVAPDGAVYVADWYDPGVGGHATGDIGARQRDWHKLTGRIYRLTPSGYKPSEVKLDLNSVPGQIAALQSPNLSTRYLAYTKLVGGGEEAQKALKEVWTGSKNPRFRARALWILARGNDGKKTVEAALKDPDSDLRVAALRAARQIKMDMVRIADQMLSDSSPAVLRELCLAMNFEPDDRAMPVLVKLADKFDGTDRWYLEALGIGATGREEKLLTAWKQDGKNKDEKVGRGIEWRLKKEPVPLDSTAQAPAQDVPVTTWWAAAGFPAEGDALNKDFGPDAHPASVDVKATYKGIDGKEIRWEQAKTSDGGPDVGQFIDFNRLCAERHIRPDNVVGYFAAAIVAPQDETAHLSVGSDDGVKVWLNGKVVVTDDATRPVHLGDDVVEVQLKKGRNLLLAKLRNGNGASGLAVAISSSQKLTISDQLDDSTAAAAPTGAPPKVFTSRDGQTLPPIPVLASLNGNPAAGEKVFRNAAGANCIKCHTIGTEGGIVGPPLTVIGQKLNKPQLYESILYPSAAIEMTYETWVVKTKGGEPLTGRKVEDTDDHLTVLDADGKYHDVPADEVVKKVKQDISLMPEGLCSAMTRQELVDLVEFLAQRK